jgi:hypothetical protein
LKADTKSGAASLEIEPLTNKRASTASVAIAYLILVGLPMTLLPFLLKAGSSRLTAPLAIAGDWGLKFGESTASVSCPWSGPKPQIASIAQSGSEITISFPDPSGLTLQGTLHGSDLRGRERASRSTVRDRRPELGLTATVRGQSKDRSMEGHFFFDSIAGCGTVSFVAVRRIDSRRTSQ